jgi:hypothetical protein
MTLRFEDSVETVAFCVLAAGLLALSWIDLRIKRLPREISYTTLALGAPLLVVAALVRDEPRRIWTMVLGAVLALAFMWALHVDQPRAAWATATCGCRRCSAPTSAGSACRTCRSGCSSRSCSGRSSASPR